MVVTGKDNQTTQAQTHTNDYGGQTISAFTKKKSWKGEVVNTMLN